ncbi:MAG: hypothetical protein COB83_08340 [Gammaproteobacteria bacterium]|nr:MAG: hypothetical protein COB83_08340 [Gammaproteobacteria bacterium]
MKSASVLYKSYRRGKKILFALFLHLRKKVIFFEIFIITKTFSEYSNTNILRMTWLHRVGEKTNRETFRARIINFAIL